MPLDQDSECLRASRFRVPPEMLQELGIAQVPQHAEIEERLQGTPLELRRLCRHRCPLALVARASIRPSPLIIQCIPSKIPHAVFLEIENALSIVGR